MSATDCTKSGLLRSFQDAAGCSHTQEKANRVWRELHPYLGEAERHDLRDSWEHYRIGGYDRELIDGSCERIRREWSEEEERLGIS